MSGINFIKIEDPEGITKKIYRSEINSEIERINKELTELKTVYNYAGINDDEYVDWKGKYESYKNKLLDYKKQQQTFFTINEDPEVPSFGGRMHKRRSKKQSRKRTTKKRRRSTVKRH